VLVIEAVVGIVLLLFGRSLFWAFVALVGFLVGAHLSQTALAGHPAWVGVLVGIGVGIVGALLAVVAERVGFALGGLAAGGYLALVAARSLHVPGNPMIWVAIGATVGALIAILVMDWAIIFLSSLVGAGAVVGSLSIGPGIAIVLYLLLAAAGVLFQGARFERVEPPPPARA
jgi:Domain of unknown function (DUF4203)